MGGNALTSVYTRRYEKDEYEAISEEISSILRNNGIVSYIPLSFKNKEDFGDLDVLIRTDSYDGSLRDVIIDIFQPNETYNNGSHISFDYKDLQIDFIKVPPREWKISKVYFSYNDLGNLMGVIVNNMGFRYGNMGLEYRHNNSKSTKVNISRNPWKIFDFIGFDYERFLKGFDTLEEIFDYVIESEYFSPSMFAYSNLNNRNRTRNKKRANYAKFLEYIKERTDIDDEYIEFDRKYLHTKIKYFFNVDLESEISKFAAHDIIKDNVKSKFNGKLIMFIYPELKGEELGSKMQNFRKYIELHYDDYNKYLLNTEISVIMKQFKNVNGL